MNLIEVLGVSVSHQVDNEAKVHSKALDNINLTIQRGEFVALLGSLGAGKSTLVRLLNALDLPSSGSVRIGGIDTRIPDRRHDIRRMVGIVFSDPDNQIVGTTVDEDIAFGPENLGLPAIEIRQRVDDALRAVGLTHLSGHPSHLLSAGERQFLALAGLLAMKPDCLILDESTARLDSSVRQDLQVLLRRLNRDENLTILLVTAKMDEAVLADRVLLLDAGRIIVDGGVEEVTAAVLSGKVSSLPPPPFQSDLDAGIIGPSVSLTMNASLQAIGSYSPGDSFLHRTDPRCKLILSLFFVAALYALQSYEALFSLFVVTFMTGIGLGRSMRSFWRGLKPILWMAASVALFNLVFVSGHSIATSGILSHVSWEGLDRSAKMALRLILLVSSATLLTATTTPLALTAGLESLMQPLKRLKIPVEQLTMLMALALRFLPIIFAEASRVISTHPQKPNDFKGAGMRTRLQNFLRLIFPLFSSLVRRGEVLGMAMESRGYQIDSKRTRMSPLQYSVADLKSCLLLSLLMVVLSCVELISV